MKRLFISLLAVAMVVISYAETKDITGSSITGFGSGTQYGEGSYDAGDGFTISSNGGFSTTQFRVAKSKTLTIASSSATMTKIEITVSSTSYKLNTSNAPKLTYSGTVGTYEDANGFNTITFSNNSTSIARITSIKITYAAAASHNITASSNNESLGTVSIDGNTITATPTACVGYASPAYTVTGTATVSQSGNTFTVTASSDCNVQINFAESVKDTYIDKVHGTIMTGDYCGTYEAPKIDDKTKVTASEQTRVCDHDHYHFVGWVATGITGSQENEPDGLIKAGTAMTATGKTYYAVWAQEKQL